VLELGSHCLWRDTSAEERRRLGREDGDDRGVVLGHRLPPVVLLAHFGLRPRCRQHALGFDELGLSLLRQLGGAFFDLRKGGELVVRHDSQLSRRVRGLLGGLGQRPRLVERRDQTIHSEDATEVLAQIESLRLCEHGVAVEHRQSGEEGWIGSVLLCQQAIQLAVRQCLAVDRHDGREAGAGLDCIRAGDAEQTAAGQLDLDGRGCVTGARHPRRAILDRGNGAEERVARALDDRRLPHAVRRHDEGRARLKLEVQALVRTPVLERQPADHVPSVPRIDATSTSTSLSACSTRRVIAAWCFVTRS
jgi:hypothetical protein